MGLYTKKPVTIEARRFETNNDDGTHMTLLCDWANEPRDKAVVTHDGTRIYVATLEGTMAADVGDWIIRGVKGELYPCKHDVFDATYAPADAVDASAMSFGDALAALKAGERVCRFGWNGKGMWLALTAGTPDLPAEKFWNPHNRAFAEQNGGTATVLPSITMKTATGEILMGWLASQTDMLADDWMVVSADAA